MDYEIQSIETEFGVDISLSLNMTNTMSIPYSLLAHFVLMHRNGNV